jgi:hypothetical protein
MGMDEEISSAKTFAAAKVQKIFDICKLFA